MKSDKRTEGLVALKKAPITQRIAIAGSTGYIGGRLVPALLAAGYAVRCLVRSPAKLEGRLWTANSLVEIRSVDLLDEQALTDGLDGCVAGFYLVHSMMSAGEEYATRDKQLASTFARAARLVGLKRIIYLGGLGETGVNLSKHLSSRREVEASLASTGVPVTVLRAAMIIGAGSASFEILRYLIHRLPVMITPKWVSTPCQPIAVQNVIAYLVGVLSAPATVGDVFDIGGSEILCYREIMSVMAEELGLPPRRILPVPLLSPRLSSYWIQLVTPLSHNIARPLAEGLKNPVICREHRITRLIPQTLLSVREAIHAALSQMAAGEVETNWSMAGPMPGDPDWSGGTVFKDAREIVIDAPAEAVFRAVCRLGGRRGWHAAKWLWITRGWLDLLAGGPGLRRGRRDPDSLSYGEALDFWRVVALERGRHLSLRAEMRLPGEALLDFRIEQKGEVSLLHQTALFRPRGLLGLLYWFAVLPFHHFVFRGMLVGIQRDALEMSLQPTILTATGK